MTEGDWLRGVREGLGLTQAGMAGMLNGRLGRRYDRHLVSRWEGGSAPAPEEAVAAARSGDVRPRAPARVVAFANQKGGVGKTTSALNVAAALTRTGHRVLLVDMDPQASATTALLAGGAVEAFRRGMVMTEAVLREAPLSAVRAVRGSALAEGVRGLPFDLCGSHIGLSEVDGRREPGSDGMLRAAVDGVRGEYDFVVVDCPPNLGLLTYMALMAADLVVVPVRTEPYDVMGVGLILDTVARARRRGNPLLEVAGLLPTQYSARHHVDARILSHLIAEMGPATPVLEPVPSSTAFGNAAMGARIALDEQPRSPAVQPYVRLARALACGGPPPLARAPAREAA